MKIRNFSYQQFKRSPEHNRDNKKSITKTRRSQEKIKNRVGTIQLLKKEMNTKINVQKQ